MNNTCATNSFAFLDLLNDYNGKERIALNKLKLQVKF